MARLRTLHRCSACEGTTPQWVGRCPSCGEWGTLVEEVVRLSRVARESLLRYGELQFASFTYVNTLWAMLDCAPTRPRLRYQVGRRSAHP